MSFRKDIMTQPAEPPDQPQAPRAICPLQTCDYSLPYPPSGDINELLPELKAHGETHTAEELLNTIGLLQNGLWEAHSHIADLEGALRGANHIMQAAGIVPKSPFEQAAEGLVMPPSGLLLPERVARELQGRQDTQRVNEHHTGTAKHGDVVPGKGKLVGKKITDPMVLRDLKKGEQDGQR